MKIILTTILLVAAPLAGAAPKNVLLIIADDLRPQLGCYGDAVVKSPVIDGFAKSAMRFDRAYVQCAVCSPSRNSFLSGLRPETTGLTGFGKTIRKAVPDVVTLPQHFKNNGYHSAGFGKIFHVYAETGLGSENDPASWSEPIFMPKAPIWGPVQARDREAHIEKDRAAGVKYKTSHDWPRGEAIDSPDLPLNGLRDGVTALSAAAFLEKRSKDSGQPFFLAVGFFLPHLPYVAPQEDFDQYDPVSLVLPSNQYPPKGAPDYSMIHGWEDKYANFPPKDRRDDSFKQEYLRAYLACISYVDRCTGVVLDALEKSGLADDTIVVFIGDHGYLVGEHGSWGNKHCNYEDAVRTPLIVKVPGAAPGSTDALVEFVDIYPSLAELAGIPAPARHEGASFAPLITNPGTPWKQAAFSIMKRGGHTGKAVRTDRYRYVEWRDGAGKLTAEELYDQQADPEENTNIASLPANSGILAEHASILKEGWREALPANLKPRSGQ